MEDIIKDIIMAKYRKRPIIVNAKQWHKDGDHVKVYPRYKSEEDVRGYAQCLCGVVMFEHGLIYTLEGRHIVCPGDWIITGIKGEHYPCKPDIFKKTYDPVDTVLNSKTGTNSPQ